MYCTRHATHLAKLIILAGRGVLVIIHSVIAATAIKRLKEDDGGWSEKGEREGQHSWMEGQINLFYSILFYSKSEGRWTTLVRGCTVQHLSRWE